MIQLILFAIHVIYMVQNAYSAQIQPALFANRHSHIMVFNVSVIILKDYIKLLIYRLVIYVH